MELARQRYSEFVHLCRSLFKRPDDLMGMVTVYCDDSGREVRNRVAVVAGYIGSVALWQRFERRWNAVLAKEGVSVLHRADLENFQGEFTEAKGWNPERRTAFLKKLHAVIKSYTYRGIGAAVIKADFEAVMPDSVKRLYGGPFGWAAHACIPIAGDWCDEKRHNEPIDWVFEAGTCGTREIGFMFDAIMRFPALQRDFRAKPKGWSFQQKSTVPLQAADLVAYEVFKQTENGILDRHIKYPMRKSVIDLIRREEVPSFQLWHGPRLAEWARRWRARGGDRVEELARAERLNRKRRKS
jgi:hypothetical protein